MMTITRTDPDHGHDLGPAAHARPSKMETIEGRAISSVRAEAIVVRRYADSTLYDRLHNAAQISDRQHSAASKFHGMWVAGSVQAPVTPAYGEARGGISTPDDEPTPRDSYRRLARSLKPAQIAMLEDMCLSRHPGIARLASLQAALSDLADMWKISERGE